MPRPAGPIVWRCSLSNTIYDVLKARPGWVETDHPTEWSFNWADRGWIHTELDKLHLHEWQRINHFPNHQELTRKDLLIKNLKRTKRHLDKEDRAAEAAAYNFFPVTYVLPREYRMFVEEFKRTGGTWIMKPIGQAQGRGIFLFNKLSQISDWRRTYTWKPDEEEAAETYLAQRYVDSPYLVGGRKFDLRIYVLITSYNPLRVYLYRSGFARFTNCRFSMRREDITNTFIHLTNVAIQKHAPTFDRDKGMKWPIRNLRLFLNTRHGPDATNALFNAIQNVILRALLAVQPVMINDKHSFELYGYDILIDSALKPWLLEVNASPSLSASDNADWTLKFGMLNDMLDIIDLEGRREPGAPYPATQGGFDVIWANGQVVQQFEQATSLPTLLGCYNPRDQNQVRQDRRAQQQQQQDGRSVQQRRSFRKTGSSGSSGGGTPVCVV